MNRNVCVVLVLLTIVGGALAQTTNNKYDVTFFAAPPPGQDLWKLPRSITADGKGLIYVFRSSQPPVLVYNRAGELQKTWGDGLFPDAHSIDFHDGFLWITDRKDQMVYKYTTDGKQLMAIGKKGVAGDNSSTEAFNQPTDVAIARNGDIWVSDGDTNSRVLHFTKDGKLIKIIGGTKGSQPGQFDHPHALAIDSKNRVLVLDQQIEAQKPRVQIFDQNGNFIEQWPDIGGVLPTGIVIANDDTVYISDADANSITVFKDGKKLDEIAYVQARPHNLAIDPATDVLYLVDPITPMRQGGGESRGPNPGGGLVKKVVKRKLPS
jgi:DNA-binding beta-propeller fold protein YncE